MKLSDSIMTGQFTKAFPALSHKNFRYFWTGQCISVVGTWMQRTAQQWLVYTLTKSALLLGILGVAQFGPMLLFSLFAGTVIDRYPKKKVLIFTQTALMIQALALAALVWSGHVRYWHVLVLAAFLGLMNTLDMPARQSFIINLVERKDLTNGIALNSAIVNMARIVGPAVSAILMVKFGAAFCFLFNGVSFIPVIIGLLLIKVQAADRKKAHDKILNATLDGLKYIKSNPVILGAVLAMLAVGTFAMNWDVIIPVFADKVLHRGANGYGFLLSASGFGSLVSALFVAARLRSNPSRKLLYASGLLVSLSMVFAYFVHRFGMAVIIIILIGFFNMLFMTLVNSTIQLSVEDSYRGRVMSVYSLAFAGSTPIGNLFAGSITQRFGPGAGFLMCGATAGFFILVLMLWILAKERLKVKPASERV